MKKIKKEHIDKLIEHTKKVYSGAPSLDELIFDRIRIAKEIAEFTGLNWLSPLDLIDCVLVPDGLKPEASNEDIYLIFKCMGWDVA